MSKGVEMMMDIKDVLTERPGHSHFHIAYYSGRGRIPRYG